MATTVHGSDQIKFGKWTFSPGVRVETIQQEYCDTNDNCGADTMQQEGTYSVIVGGAGLKYDYYTAGGEEVDFFGGIHRGFSPAGPRSRLKDGVNPEYSLGFELGTRYSNAKKAFGAEAVLFLTRLDDMVVNDSVGGTGTGNTENLGKVQTAGIELQANYDHGLAKGWAVQTPMYVAATYTDARFMSSTGSTDNESIFAGAVQDNKLPYIPAANVSFGLGAIYKKFSANLDANYVSQAFADGSNMGEITPASERLGTIDARLVVDGAMGYQYSNKVRIFANLRNITNNAYMVSRQPHGARPGAPLTVMGGLEFSL